MTSGDLIAHTGFFITSSKDDGKVVYDIARDDKNGVLAPQFMLPVINRVFVAGKTMDFVKRMPSSMQTNSSSSDSFPRIEVDGINPFGQSFQMTLDTWITEKYTLASEALKDTIHDTSALWKELDRVHGIYCLLSYRNMTLFMDKLFQKVCSIFRN